MTHYSGQGQRISLGLTVGSMFEVVWRSVGDSNSSSASVISLIVIPLAADEPTLCPDPDKTFVYNQRNNMYNVMVTLTWFHFCKRRKSNGLLISAISIHHGVSKNS